MKTKNEKEEIFDYLDDLKELGIVNMFEAIPYLKTEFGFETKIARGYLL